MNNIVINKKSNPGLHLLFRTLKRVLKKDDEYIKRALLIGEDPDLIEIKHNGTNDYGKIIYVIKENTGLDGFCATIVFIIYYLIFAEQHGLAPVIKLSSEYAYYDEEMSKKIDNPWEYYFLTDGETYDEKKALNVCYAKWYQMLRTRELYDLSAYKSENYHNEKVFQICTPLIKRYLKLKTDITDEAVTLLKRVREGGGKILGVHFRGTDFRKGYYKHPVYVDVRQTIEEVKKALAVKCFAAVFIATDDASAYEEIKDCVGDTELLRYPGVYRSDEDTSVTFSKSERKYHHYLLGYEIARDMYTLSLCDALVAGKSSVSFLSNLYKHSRDEAYEYMNIIDNGNHENDGPKIDPSGEKKYGEMRRI